jgi:hypothetical protein
MQVTLLTAPKNSGCEGLGFVLLFQLGIRSKDRWLCGNSIVHYATSQKVARSRHNEADNFFFFNLLIPSTFTKPWDLPSREQKDCQKQKNHVCAE